MRYLDKVTAPNKTNCVGYSWRLDLKKGGVIDSIKLPLWCSTEVSDAREPQNGSEDYSVQEAFLNYKRDEEEK